jgi:hypothetical protein
LLGDFAKIKEQKTFGKRTPVFNPKGKTALAVGFSRRSKEC